MLSEKEKLEEELKLLKESLDLDVITKEEFEDAKNRIEVKLEDLERRKEIEFEDEPEIIPSGNVKEETKTEVEEKEEAIDQVKEEPAKEEVSESEEEPEKKLEVKAEEEKIEDVEKLTEAPILEDAVEKKKDKRRVIIYTALIIILSLVLAYTFFSGGSEVAGGSTSIPVENIPSLVACSSDTDCTKEGGIGTCLNAGKRDAECTYIKGASVQLTILNTNDCFNCETERVAIILKGLFPNLNITSIDFGTEEGNEIAERFNIDALPAYILDSNAREAKNYDKFSSAFNEIDGNFIMKNTVSNANYYLGRGEIPNKLDLFVKENQTASSKAEKNLEEFLEAFKGKVVFEKHDGNSGIAKELGINTFPTFLVNNKIKFSGVQPADKIKENFCEMNQAEECGLELSKSLI